jgi:glycine/D-amino acid oxidase-like deaminating enzyme/nitrite reductase/ring-hydroxylating ferredoxin subunit
VFFSVVNLIVMTKSAKKRKVLRDSNTESLWQQIDSSLLTAKSAPLIAETTYDVLIIGAGITGVTTALLLQKAGKKCVLAEANTIGFGTTSGTTAHLNTFFDLTYPEIESNFSADAAKQVAKAGKEALSIIRSHIDEYKIDCDFEEKDGYLFSENEKETEDLAKILQSSQEANVIVEEVEENGVPIKFQHSLLFKNQAQFHPIKYIMALVAEFQKLGGIVSEHTFIKETEFDEGIHTAKGDSLIIKAKNIVYATHIPPGVNLFSFRCAPYRSYVLGIKLTDNAYPTCVSYDMQDPYHYFRTHQIDGEPYLILGGEDHKTGHGDPTTAFKNLETYARKYFKVKSIPYKWSAQYYIPADGLPYIGLMPAADDKIYIATGFNGNGMQFGTLSAKIISDTILGKEHEHAELFSASRVKPIAGFADFIKENADVAYHFIADRFSAEEIESLKEIKPDEGMLVDFKNQKLAIYKSKTGKITALNPVCTHAKCIVNFNNEEKSWDCPCHGGRFDVHGKVLTGPPRKDLQEIKLK